MRTYTHCVRCGAKKVLPKQAARPPIRKPTARPRKASNYVDPATYERDPYCSRVCCEAALAEGAQAVSA